MCCAVLLFMLQGIWNWLVRNPAEYNDIQLKLPDTTFSY